MKIGMPMDKCNKRVITNEFTCQPEKIYICHKIL